jgi:hypothetical protein
MAKTIVYKERRHLGMYALVDDLELAKREIVSGASVACVARGVILDKEVGRRLLPAFKVLCRLQGMGYANKFPIAFADKVMGLAAFRLAYLAGARIMWGEMASDLAVLEGKRRGVPVYYHRIVPAILNMSQSGLCPMEHLAFVSTNDEEFFSEMSARITGAN